MPLSAGEKLGPYENLAPIGAGVQQIVRKCLAKLPAERFQNRGRFEESIGASRQSSAQRQPSIAVLPLPT